MSNSPLDRLADFYAEGQRAYQQQCRVKRLKSIVDAVSSPPGCHDRATNTEDLWTIDAWCQRFQIATEALRAENVKGVPQKWSSLRDLHPAHHAAMETWRLAFKKDNKALRRHLDAVGRMTRPWGEFIEELGSEAPTWMLDRFEVIADIRPSSLAHDLALQDVSDWLAGYMKPGECRMLPAQRPQADNSEPTPPQKKRSTEKDEGREKLIAALTKHHQYADGGCMNPEPIGNNALAKAAGVSTSTASTFFGDKFQGHAKYMAMCRNLDKLIAALKLLNGEFSPHHLYGSRPANEDNRHDE